MQSGWNLVAATAIALITVATRALGAGTAMTKVTTGTGSGAEKPG